MKNSEIHEGLEKKDIRDFLSSSIALSFKRECSAKKDYSSFSDKEGLEWSILSAEEELRTLKIRISEMKKRQAAISIMNSQGWLEFDVSEYVTKNESDDIFFMNFIGTEKEYSEFMKKLKKKQYAKH